MRKTNSKEVKLAVKNYIVECEEMELKEIKERFISEYGWAIPRMGELNACIEWLRGLAIGCHYCYEDIVYLLAEWLEDTPENQWKWVDKKGTDLYWLLMAREIVASK